MTSVKLSLMIGHVKWPTLVLNPSAIVSGGPVEDKVLYVSYCSRSNWIEDILHTVFQYVYCTFHKHANSKVQKPPSQLRFLLPSIIITITSNEPWNTETHKMDRNPPITNQKTRPFEPVKVKFCFLRGLLRWLMAAKNAIVSWLLNVKIGIFMKSAVK